MSKTITIPADWMGSNPLVIDINTEPKHYYEVGQTYTVSDEEAALIEDALAMYPKEAEFGGYTNGNYRTTFGTDKISVVCHFGDLDVCSIGCSVQLLDDDGNPIYSNKTLPIIEPAENDWGAKLLDNERAEVTTIIAWSENDGELVPYAMSIEEFKATMIDMIGAEDAQIYIDSSTANDKYFGYILSFDAKSDVEAQASFKEMIDATPISMVIDTEVYETVEVQ